MTAERAAYGGVGYPMVEEPVRDFDKRRERLIRAVGDEEVARLGIRRAIEIMDWLGEQTEGRIDTYVACVDVIDCLPQICVGGSWWLGDDETGERRDLEERIFNAGTSRARMTSIARSMLDEFRKSSMEAAE